jgi:hypothetical protein
MLPTVHHRPTRRPTRPRTPRSPKAESAIRASTRRIAPRARARQQPPPRVGARSSAPISPSAPGSNHSARTRKGNSTTAFPLETVFRIASRAAAGTRIVNCSRAQRAAPSCTRALAEPPAQRSSGDGAVYRLFKARHRVSVGARALQDVGSRAQCDRALSRVRGLARRPRHVRISRPA